MVVGIDLDRQKDVLEMWIGVNESAMSPAETKRPHSPHESVVFCGILEV